MKLKPAKLFIDGIQEYIFDGYVEVGQDHYGWARPYFTKEVCEQILKTFMHKWEYDDTLDTFFYKDLYYIIARCVGKQLQGFSEPLYPLGNNEWVWVEQI
jgi:hypothetical protein